MHPDPNIEASAMSLWFDVFSEHVKRGPTSTFVGTAYINASPPVVETAQECVNRAATLADAAEAKLRERFARKPVSGDQKVVSKNEQKIRDFAAKYEDVFFAETGTRPIDAPITMITMWIAASMRSVDFANFTA